MKRVPFRDLLRSVRQAGRRRDLPQEPRFFRNGAEAMRTVPLYSLLPVLILWAGAEWPNGQRQPASAAGAVEGIVVNTDGRPVAGVRVYPMQTGPTPFSVTDVRGRFELVGVQAGSVRIMTSKMEEGYPDTGSGMYGVNLESIPVVLVQPGATTDNVVVKLGMRLGVLRGTVIDAASGKRVPTARIRIAREDNPANFLSTNVDEAGQFVLAWPAHVRRLEVTAPGFKAWRSDVDLPEGHLTVPSGAEKALVVRMRR